MRFDNNITSFKEKLLFKICNFMFYIAYFLIISSDMLRNVNGFSVYVRFSDKFGYLILMISFLLYVYKRDFKIILLQTTILAILFISFHISKERELLIMFLLIIAFQGMNLRTLIKYDISIKLFLMIVVLILYNFKLTDTYYMLREDGQIRSSMGFSHPNTFGAYLLSICIDIFYLNFKKIGILYYVFAIFIALIIRYFADSRTSIYALILLCIIHIIFKISNKKLFTYKLIEKVMIYLFFILTFFSISLTYLYKMGNSLVYHLDNLTTGRINLILYFMENYRITLFGNEIPLILTRELEFTGIRYLNYLDNGFILLLLRNGVLIFLLAGIFFYKSIKKLFEVKSYDLIIIFFVFLITGLFESFFYTIHFNTFILYFSQFVLIQTNDIQLLRKNENLNHTI